MNPIDGSCCQYSRQKQYKNKTTNIGLFKITSTGYIHIVYIDNRQQPPTVKNMLHPYHVLACFNKFNSTVISCSPALTKDNKNQD